MRQRRQLIGRRDVLWTLAAFLGMELAFLIVVEITRPGLYDQEYGVRINLLDRQTKAHPERPVLLVVGSSRIGLGFLPETLPPLKTPDGRDVLTFNYSHLGAGPRMNLLQVRRALKAGVKPEWIVLEIVPGGLGHEGSQATWATATDLPGLLRWTGAGRVCRDYLRTRLNPFFKLRQGVLREVAPVFVTKACYNDVVTLEPLGDDHHWMRIDDNDPFRREKQTEVVQSIYADRLKELPIDPKLDGATHEVLELCQARGIKVELLLTPEDSLFRSWYGPSAKQRLKRYLAELRGKYGVETVDARRWVADAPDSESRRTFSSASTEPTASAPLPAPSGPRPARRETARPSGALPASSVPRRGAASRSPTSRRRDRAG